jgi:hypothetical protein
MSPQGWTGVHMCKEMTVSTCAHTFLGTLVARWRTPAAPSMGSTDAAGAMACFLASLLDG